MKKLLITIIAIILILFTYYLAITDTISVAEQLISTLLILIWQVLNLKDK
jgi:hypothetical protein